MSASDHPRTGLRIVALAGWLLLPTAAVGQGPYTVTMRAMVNPLPVGQCTFIEIRALDPRGYPPVDPKGRQVDWQSFELSFTAASPDAFTWKDERHAGICAVAPTAPTALIVAHYPGRQVPPEAVIPGLALEQSIEVAMKGVPAGPPPAGPTTAAAQPQPASGAPPSPDPYAQSGTNPPPADAAVPTGYAPALPGMAPTPSQGGAAPASGRVTSGKQFVSRISSHAKQKAGDVAAQTAGDVADAAGDVVDTTLTAGHDLVTTNARAATDATGQQVRKAGSALTLGGAQDDPEDIGKALASGRAVFRRLTFASGGSAIDPASVALLERLARAIMSQPAQYLIEAHVEGGDAAAAQALSDQRAAAVKAALAGLGVPPNLLAAVGYGVSRPVAGGRSSARIEVARTQ